MCNELNKKYKCTAHITYEFIVKAGSEEDAENNVFTTIADDIGKGIIPMDVYDNTDCFPIPMLASVDVLQIEAENI